MNEAWQTWTKDMFLWMRDQQQNQEKRIMQDRYKTHSVLCLVSLVGPLGTKLTETSVSCSAVAAPSTPAQALEKVSEQVNSRTTQLAHTLTMLEQRALLWDNKCRQVEASGPQRSAERAEVCSLVDWLHIATSICSWLSSHQVRALDCQPRGAGGHLGEGVEGVQGTPSTGKLGK